MKLINVIFAVGLNNIGDNLITCITVVFNIALFFTILNRQFSRRVKS